VMDITDRKRAEEELKRAYAELKETQEKLVQSEKLAALGRFSSGIAHEIKNPLGIILGGIGFLESRLTSIDHETKTAMDKIKESTLRADAIIQALLKFARPSELKTERIKPQDIIRETLSLLKYRAPLKGIKITTQLSIEDLYIKVDKNQIQQVLFNLLMNAVEAMPNGGQISINLDKAVMPELGFQLPLCLIRIVDSGEGVPGEDLQRIFEPFFTTKIDRKGTGLGLSISKMIVEKHKGDLIIESQSGKGTDVKLLIPLD
jgi:two-component system NtrC family sensor kinase